MIENLCGVCGIIGKRVSGKNMEQQPKPIKINILVIMFAFFYITQGYTCFISGAMEGSRFYEFDDFLIRFYGFLLMAFSTGLLFKKEWARKGIIFALSLAVVEMVVGAPVEFEWGPYLQIVFQYMIIYLPGLIYFILFKDKEYFS